MHPIQSQYQLIQSKAKPKVLKTIVKKKSKWLKLWKTRQVVLYPNILCFYKQHFGKKKQTMEIVLSQVDKIESSETKRNVIKITSKSKNYFIEFEDQHTRMKWEEQITGKSVRRQRSQRKSQELFKFSIENPQNCFFLFNQRK